MTFEDLVVKYVLDSRGTAWKHYRDAVNRIHTILELLEKEKGVRLKLDFVEDKFKRVTGDLPKSHQYFLLNRLLDIDAETISRLEGKKLQPSEIRKMIIRINDGLRCGEIRLFDATTQEIEASRKQLENHRERVRRIDRKKRKKA